jgi:hypothetical protein
LDFSKIPFFTFSTKERRRSEFISNKIKNENGNEMKDPVGFGGDDCGH